MLVTMAMMAGMMMAACLLCVYGQRDVVMVVVVVRAM